MSLDMNKFDEIIEKDLEQFDFEEAVKIMNKLNHTWCGYEDDETGEKRSPTVLDVYKQIRKRIIEGYEYIIEHNIDFLATSTGGFRIESRHNDDDGYWSVIMYCPVESMW